MPIIALFTQKGREFMKKNPVLFVILALIAFSAGAVALQFLKTTDFVPKKEAS